MFAKGLDVRIFIKFLKDLRKYLRTYSTLRYVIQNVYLGEIPRNEI